MNKLERTKIEVESIIEETYQLGFNDGYDQGKEENKCDREHVD